MSLKVNRQNSVVNACGVSVKSFLTLYTGTWKISGGNGSGHAIICAFVYNCGAINVVEDDMKKRTKS